MGVYFHSLGKEAVGDAERLALLASTVSESTTNFSMRDWRLTNMSAPFPLTAGRLTEELWDAGFRTVAMGLMGDAALGVAVKGWRRWGRAGWLWLWAGLQGLGQGRGLTTAPADCECGVQESTAAWGWV